MANFQVKDFTTGLAVKIRAFIVNTDENVAVHSLVDTANGEILGTLTETAPATDTASSGLNGRLQRIAQRLTSLLPANLTVKAASTAPVVTDPALVVAISPNSQNANGSTTDANSAPVAWSTEGKAQIGAVAETAPASDTASSGLNGRLQRIAQNITTMIAATLKVALQAATSGGLSRSRTLIPNNTTAIVVKSGAGQLYKVRATNNSATIAYIKLYDKARTPIPVALATPVNAAFSTATTGGTLAAGTYYYRVSAINAAGETLASTETSQVTTGTTSTVTVNWGAVSGATGYKVYGRTTGGELLIATLGTVTTYTDTGAVTPAGALPGANTSFDTPDDTIMIPASASGAGIVDTTDVGTVHATGITYTVTTGIADADTAAPAANAYIVTMFYK